jgi:hypothetical protein
MSGKRHDWLKYKQDFFDSPIDEIVHFFATFTPPITKNQYGKRIGGWKAEKQAYKRKQSEAAREQMAKNPDIQDMNSMLIMSKANALKLVMTKLTVEKGNLGLRDLREAIDIIKRELGEPLTITDNKNKNETEIVLGEDFKRLMTGYMGEYKPPSEP